MRKPADKDPWRAEQLCKHCNGGEGGECDPIILCDCCVSVGGHLSCIEKATGLKIDPSEADQPSFQWFCSQDCENVSQRVVDLLGQKLRADNSDAYTVELVRFSEAFRSSHTVVNTVLQIFHSAFGPSCYSDGSDLVELVCRGKHHTLPPKEMIQKPDKKKKNQKEEEEEEDDEEEEPPDCTNFLVYALRQGGVIVAAAAVRIHGTLMAELPYVATRQGYRRAGNCRRLIHALQETLQNIGVKWMVIPAVEATLPMWTSGFGFAVAPNDVADAVEDRIILPDETTIVIKQVAPTPTPATRQSAAQQPKSKRVRFSVPQPAAPQADEDADSEATLEEDWHGGGGSASDDDDSDSGTLRGCSNCSTTKSKEWHEDDDSGDFLCDPCGRYKKRTGKERPLPAIAAAARKANSLQGQGAGASSAGTGTPAVAPSAAASNKDADEKACYNCGSGKCSRSREHGKWECVPCARYRKDHEGEVRPPTLYQKRKRTAPAAIRASSGPPCGPSEGRTPSGGRTPGSTVSTPGAMQMLPVNTPTPSRYRPSQQQTRTRPRRSDGLSLRKQEMKELRQRKKTRRAVAMRVLAERRRLLLAPEELICRMGLGSAILEDAASKSLVSVARELSLSLTMNSQREALKQAQDHEASVLAAKEAEAAALKEEIAASRTEAEHAVQALRAAEEIAQKTAKEAEERAILAATVNKAEKEARYRAEAEAAAVREKLAETIETQAAETAAMAEAAAAAAALAVSLKADVEASKKAADIALQAARKTEEQASMAAREADERIRIAAAAADAEREARAKADAEAAAVREELVQLKALFAEKLAAAQKEVALPVEKVPLAPSPCHQQQQESQQQQCVLPPLEEHGVVGASRRFIPMHTGSYGQDLSGDSLSDRDEVDSRRRIHMRYQSNGAALQGGKQHEISPKRENAAPAPVGATHNPPEDSSSEERPMRRATMARRRAHLVFK